MFNRFIHYKIRRRKKKKFFCWNIYIIPCRWILICVNLSNCAWANFNCFLVIFVWALVATFCIKWKFSLKWHLISFSVMLEPPTILDWHAVVAVAVVVCTVIPFGTCGIRNSIALWLVYFVSISLCLASTVELVNGWPAADCVCWSYLVRWFGFIWYENPLPAAIFTLPRMGVCAALAVDDRSFVVRSVSIPMADSTKINSISSNSSNKFHQIALNVRSKQRQNIARKETKNKSV